MGTATGRPNVELGAHVHGTFEGRVEEAPNQRTHREGDVTWEHVWTNGCVALGGKSAAHDPCSQEPHIQEAGIHP